MLVTKYLIIIVSIVRNYEALDNGLALTPPMGWMHWERYRCITNCEKYPNECISELLFINTVNLLLKEGYADAGYEYVIIDDCWLAKARDNRTMKLKEDSQRFPNGLKYLANYIHDKGLKFGLYQDFGTHTCAGYPGVIDHMALDVRTLVDWEVDYIKLDGCYSNLTAMETGYPEFGHLLNITGRPIVYSCSWPAYQSESGELPKYDLLKKYCNLWRNWNDIDDSFESVIHIMDYFAKNQEELQPHAGPGHWNDPDMLILGNYGLSYDQSKVQMAVWSILAAPLIMSNDLKSVKAEIKDILQNRYIIAINQDKLGIQGKLVLQKNNIQVWIRPVTPLLESGEHSYAVAFVSRRADGAPYEFNITLHDINLSNLLGYRVTDLFNNNNFIGHYQSTSCFETRVNPSGVTFYKFTVNAEMPKD